MWNTLSCEYTSFDQEKDTIDEIDIIDSYNYEYTAIESVEIYSDNPYIQDYRQFYEATDTIKDSKWYQKAISRKAAFWEGLPRQDENGTTYYNICLIRQIPLVDSKYHAVLVMRLSDNYLRTRLREQQYSVVISVNEGSVSFCSDNSYYGQELTDLIPVDYSKEHYTYQGTKRINGRMSMLNGNTLSAYRVDSRLYITTIDYNSISRFIVILVFIIIILLLALIVPYEILRLFSRYFSDRVVTLKSAVHKVSSGEYDIVPSLEGEDEISEAFSDLVITAHEIKQQNEQMYKAQLDKKELLSRQSQMELKMLTSQINPHFLYNTLETIRMKAVTAGDREVAKAIKILGKMLRFVLDKGNSDEVSLASSLDHVENYLSIQKMRFGDKVGYEIHIDDDIDPESVTTMPLIIQPLVENAIQHGLREKEGNGIIRVDITKVMLDSPEEDSKSALKITVTDNGEGMSAERLSELKESIKTPSDDGSSIGISNVYNRIKLKYKDPYTMTIDSTKGVGTVINLYVPIQIRHN
jgi:two-component system sensor histidine kinase YesM